MVSCTNCGLENKDTFAYCVRCGTTLEKQSPDPVPAVPMQELKECPQCGATVPSMFRFCGTCGHPFEDKPARSSLHSTQQANAYRRDTDDAPPDVASAINRVTQSMDDATLDTIPTRIPVAPKGETPSIRIDKLVVINHDGSEGSVIPLSGRVIDLGRDSFVSTLREDLCLSPKHIRIRQTAAGYEITDISDGNGVFIMVRQTPMELNSGDTIRFGRQLGRFAELEPLDPVSTPDETLKAGSPTPDYWGLFSIMSHPDVICQSYPLRSATTVFGREVGDVLISDDLYISGSHFQINKIKKGSYTIQDLHSSNGTYIRIHKPVLLKSGDRIMMGQQLFLLKY